MVRLNKTSEFELSADAYQLLRMIFKAIKLYIFFSLVKNNNFIAIYQRVARDDWAVNTYLADRKFYRTIMNENLRDGEVFIADLVKFKSILEDYLKVLKKNYSAISVVARDILQREVPISLRTNLIRKHLQKKFNWNDTHIRSLAKLLRDLIKVYEDCCSVTLKTAYHI